MWDCCGPSSAAADCTESAVAPRLLNGKPREASLAATWPFSRLTIPEGTEPDQTVTHCVYCGYWLRGLPACGRCPECGNAYDKFGGAWRDGRTLVMGKDLLLPRRCIKCNAPVDELTFKRKLYWHHPVIYLLLLLSCYYGVGLLLYLLAATLSRKKAVIFVGLCDRHRSRRRWLLGVFGVLFTASIILIYSAVASQQPDLALVAAALLLACVVLVSALQSVRTRRIDAHFIWLRGARASFLAELPELPKSMRR